MAGTRIKDPTGRIWRLLMNYKTKRNKFEREVDKKILFFNANYLADVLVRIVKTGDDVVISEPIVELGPGSDINSVNITVHWDSLEIPLLVKFWYKIIRKDLKSHFEDKYGKN